MTHETDPKVGPPASPSHGISPGTGSWRTRHPLRVILLSVAVIAIGGAVAFRSIEKSRTPPRVVRSRGGTLAAVATVLPDGGVRLAWSRVPHAALYHVKLEGATGKELSKDSRNPSLVLPQREIASLGNVRLTIETESPTGERTSAVTTLTLVPGGSAPERPDTPNR